MNKLVIFILLSALSIYHDRAEADNKQCKIDDLGDLHLPITSNEVAKASGLLQTFLEKIPTDAYYFINSFGTLKEKVTFFDSNSLELRSSGKQIFTVQSETFPDYRPESFQIYSNILSEQNTVSAIGDRRYNRQTSQLDKHPLFSRVKRSERAVLLAKLNELTKQPALLISPKLELSRTRVGNLVRHYDQPLLSIYLDDNTISTFSIPNHQFVISINVFQNNLYNLNENELKVASKIYCQLTEDIETLFGRQPLPGVADYQYFLNQLGEMFPLYERFLTNPTLYKLVQIIILLLISGFVYLTATLLVKEKSSASRVVSVKKTHSYD